ncbi:MAG: hypothetical protein BHV67_05720 [Bacteroidales bacterium 43_36]|nr:MAG: hypothetical protein BHV67_05720 [Bacteroidales bacterium 43_36]
MGNKTFIDTFVELQNKLHRVATQLLNDQSEAEDAIQDTFCNLWNSNLPETSEEARYKLFAVLRNVCLNKLKKKQRYTQIMDNDVILPEEQYEESERIKKLLFSSLTPLQKKILQMVVSEDMDYEEVARRLDLSVESVRMNVCRARKKMREIYKRI